jgi:predicted alpha/beta-hydrolase family hydrolase
VPLEAPAAVTALIYRTEGPREPVTLVLAHGAGAGQRSAFITAFATRLSELGLDVVTFNFPYTEQRRRLPDRRPVLEACYRAVIDVARRELQSAGRFLFIGGKSMGGRIATHVAAADRDLAISGIVLLGYPLHPPGRPNERRDAHLPAVGRPMLVVQGSRDAFGTPAELEPVLSALAPPATLHVVPGGDHSFKLQRAAEPVQAAAYDDVQRTIVEWIGRVMRPAAAETEPLQH